VEYSLTDLGEQLVPAINAIADVGHKLKLRQNARPGSRIRSQAAE
jgi:DNA-binding HxlR family transcriptional regulator